MIVSPEKVQVKDEADISETVPAPPSSSPQQSARELDQSPACNSRQSTVNQSPACNSSHQSAVNKSPDCNSRQSINQSSACNSSHQSAVNQSFSCIKTPWLPNYPRFVIKVSIDAVCVCVSVCYGLTFHLAGGWVEKSSLACGVSVCVCVCVSVCCGLTFQTDSAGGWVEKSSRACGEVPGTRSSVASQTTPLADSLSPHELCTPETHTHVRSLGTHTDTR